MVPIVIEKIKELKERNDCSVCAFVVDNASNMAGTRKEVQSAMEKMVGDGTLQKEMLLLDTYGCSAHLLNLCGGDILTPEKKQEGQTILGIVASVISVVKAFRNIHVLKFTAEEAGLKKAPLPGETRWNSYCDTLEW